MKFAVFLTMCACMVYAVTKSVIDLQRQQQYRVGYNSDDCAEDYTRSDTICAAICPDSLKLKDTLPTIQ